jgi:hypothetical protein
MAGDSEAIDVVLEEISGDVTVKEGVGGEFRSRMDEEEAERGARHEGKYHPDPSLCSRLRHLSASY